MTDEQLNKRFDDIDRRFDDVVELMRQIETNLLTAFHGYARGVSARLTTHDATDVTLNERMVALEERVLNLETRGRRGGVL